MKINGKPYRGDFRLVPVSQGKFDVVNDVDLESYLKGVLSREMLRELRTFYRLPQSAKIARIRARGCA